MNNFRTSRYGALGQHVSSDAVELTSFNSIDSITTNDGQADTSDQHEWPRDSEDVELAG
jgi:hypothetical protein